LAHCWPHNLVAAIIAAAHKQAAHGVATMLTSAKEIASMDTSYFCAASLLYMIINVRETMWWWLAVARKKMWWCIASFGDSYHNDVLQNAKQLFSTRIPQMTKCWVMKECENILRGYLYDGDLVFVILKGISIF
jgi:hypothetical protein